MANETNEINEKPAQAMTPDVGERTDEGPMGKTELHRIFTGLVTAAIDFVDGELSPDRAKATEMYNGRPMGNEVKGRSQVVSTDIRDAVRGALPAMLKALVGSERAVEFRARFAQKMEEAEQATDYTNFVFLEDNEGVLATLSVLKDGLVKGLGVFKWYWDDTKFRQNFSRKGMSEAEIMILMEDETIEVSRIDDAGTIHLDPTQPPVELFDVEFRVTLDDGRARVVAVPPEEIVYNREARSLEEALIFAHVTEKTWGELVAMGIPRKVVEEYGTVRSKERKDNDEAIARNPLAFTTGNDEDEAGEANQKATYVEGYVRLDYDGDGIRELRKICSIGEDDHIVENVPVEDIPFAIFTPDPEPHTIKGLSFYDVIGETQRVKTMIKRSMLDSLALSISPRKWYVDGRANLSDLVNNALGAPMRVKTGQNDVGEFTHTFVGKEAFPVLAYFDDEIERRTGQNKGAAGMEMDALQSSTKEAVGAVTSASQAQQELMVRVFSEGTMKRVMRGILRLLIEKQPRARMLRLRNKWVDVDPRSWDADMEMTVNVSLGTGTRQERIGILMGIAAKQAEILQSLGPQNPLTNMKQYRDTLAQIAELNGLKDSSKYFMEVDLEALKAQQEAAANQPPPPSPDMILAQAHIQIEQIKAQRQMELEQMKTERQLANEQLKAQNDLRIKQQEMEIREREMILKDDRERDKAAAEIALKRVEMNLTYQANVTQQQLDAEIEHTRTLTQNSPEEGVAQPKRVRVVFERDANDRIIAAEKQHLED